MANVKSVILKEKGGLSVGVLLLVVANVVCGIFGKSYYFTCLGALIYAYNMSVHHFDIFIVSPEGKQKVITITGHDWFKPKTKDAKREASEIVEKIGDNIPKGD